MSEDGNSDPLSNSEPVNTTSASRPSTRVEPPTMPSVESDQTVASTYNEKPGIEKLDEIVGELMEEGGLFYFARWKEGITQKFHSAAMQEQYPNLVAVYKNKKAQGLLPSFDPTSVSIHPRVRLKLNLSKRPEPKLPDSDEVPDSQGEDDQSQDEEEEDAESDSEASGNDADFAEDSAPVGSRRSTRSKRKAPLPFSPRKTRGARVVLSVDSDSDEPAAGVGTRRSTRTRQAAKKNLAEDNYSDEDSFGEEDSGSETATRKGKGKSKKTPKKTSVRVKASRPVYGHFRDVADLEWDGIDDDAILRAHRDSCEKCHRGPAHVLLQAERKKPKRSRKKKQTSDDEFDEPGDIEDRLIALGGWVRCLRCPVVAHWGCIAASQRDEILKAARDRDRAEWRKDQDPADLEDAEGNPIVRKDQPGKRPGLNENQLTDFICGACIKGGSCLHCDKVVLAPDGPQTKRATSAMSTPSVTDVVQDIQMTDANAVSVEPIDDDPELFFRCITCKRVAHYEHLTPPTDHHWTKVELAEHYQHDWQCADCSSFTYELDLIIAWRPYPAGAEEPRRKPGEVSNPKSLLPREYLVKWVDRSYRRIQWVPHAWLLAKHPAKLKNFLTSGTKIDLLAEPVSDENAMEIDTEATFEIGADTSKEASSTVIDSITLASNPTPDAERRIPPTWKTVDRVLEIILWRSTPKRKKNGKKMRIDSDDEDNGSEDDERNEIFATGEEPPASRRETLQEWERRTKQTFSIDNIDSVIWAFCKWEDLTYDQSSWDSPPKKDEIGYTAFRTAVQRYIISRTITVSSSKAGDPELQNRARDKWGRKHMLKSGEQPMLGQHPALKLMPFQVDGYNWLCNNWWNLQPCILADEMGLGKTVQIAAFVGTIVAQFRAFPILIVVPNSTITNWVRELVRWAPELHVVPFYGENKARDIIKNYELFHPRSSKIPKGTTGAKFHVLVTTYETLTNTKDFTPVFKSQPRWEALIVDEGQRLKSDSSLLFKKLNELNTIHRIIMTGTPLNNNIRELFNLMNFLDPAEWNDLEELEKEHEELTEELVKSLHNRLRPYFLRRIKSEVLTLPPKNEVIVPISMAPLQKEVYRSILSHNLDILNELSQPVGAPAKTKTKINNVLMQLRKCLQHPYLYDQDIEPANLGRQEAHEKLIDASGKLRFLKTLLPKLKAGGHRVLLFSQFVIALNVIEDFLVGEGLKYLRLDGNTKGTDRQKGMDEFNRPGSDVFIYLLTTRAGGVGINLWSADTVIISDPDFNPHQDLQAIARAYRYGQKKTCLVFKLMVKDSAEERIVQVGRKKMVLDHLIVQKMDDDDSGGDDVQSILTFGAKALFEDKEGTRDITYSDLDVEKLIAKTEKEGDQEAPKAGGGLSFEFAQVWAADKDELEDVGDDVAEDQGDSWAQTLQRITAEREKVIAQEITGRGARRRAALNAEGKFGADGVPRPITQDKGKGKGRQTSLNSEGSDYSVTDPATSGDEAELPPVVEPAEIVDITAKPKPKRRRKETKPNQELSNPLTKVPLRPLAEPQYPCGLCHSQHGDRFGDCPMTERSEFLADYREMLLLHADDEPVEHRKIAIAAIDDVLKRRGHLDLVNGQPLCLVEPISDVRATAPKPATTAPVNQGSVASSSNKPMGTAVDLSPLPATDQVLAPKQLKSIMGTTKPVISAPRPRDTSSIAGSSKRTLSSPPLPDQPPRKKQSKYASSSSCQICGRSPHHLIKDCPVVNSGPKILEPEIRRLEADPTMTDTVSILVKVLAKQKAKDARQAATSAIEVSD